MLRENNVKINSLKACEIVYTELLEKFESKRKALRYYKGIVSENNNYLVDNVLKIEEKLLDSFNISYEDK